MQTVNNPEQIQVFFELAMSIGSSLDLKEMVKTTLISYLRKLNCSSGAVLQLFQNDSGINFYKSVISIPYKSSFSSEFKEVFKLIPNNSDLKTLEEFSSLLPITKKINSENFIYLMNLPGFGLICLRKNGKELSHDILHTLISLNTKLAQGAIACMQNNHLLLSKEKAEESDRLKTAFIENISHEIRTPLNAIIGYSSLISNKQIPAKMLPSACKTIVSSSDNLLKMIEGLLDISMLESGNLKLKYNLFNINQLLIEQEQTFYTHVRIEQKEQLNLRVVTPHKDFFIVSDELGLKQVFENLIANAIRFTEQGEIEIGYLNNPNFESGEMPDKITFYVKDLGIGIPIEHHENIFKPFVRIEHSKEKLYRGASVGLTITKRLIELLEGEIGIESALEKGTIIYFTIPTIKTVDELITDL